MNEWIKDSKRSDSLSNALTKLPEGEYGYVAFYSNQLRSGTFNGTIEDEEHLLELRIFNEAAELKVIRSSLGTSFSWRVASEADVNPEFYASEIQLLDIDKALSNNEFRAIGAGTYTLPVSKAVDSIELVNYIRFDEFGNMQFADYRIKRFFKGGGE